MSEHDHDDSDADALDERIADLYRSGSVEEPAPELDRRILDAAANGPTRRRWPIAALATAAVAVLTVTLMLPNGTEQEAFEPPPAADAEARAKFEEAVATRSRYRADAAPEPIPSAAESAAPAAPASPHYTAPGCSSSYALPPDAMIGSVPGGIVVRARGEAFTLRCSDGSWQREPVTQEDR